MVLDSKHVSGGQSGGRRELAPVEIGGVLLSVDAGAEDEEVEETGGTVQGGALGESRQVGKGYQAGQVEGYTGYGHLAPLLGKVPLV